MCSSNNQNRDPFLQRAIEYWLDSANELGYQPLFCESLINKGYSLKYSIKNTSFEQGKDVVAVDSEGIPHAYQLKGGKITLDRWRREVRPEIEALIDCPIEHPEIKKEDMHESHLVTNGELDDSVRVEINSLNSKKWKETPLRLETRGDLLSAFQKMAEGMFPIDAQMYRQIVDLMFVDGEGSPNLDRVNNFLVGILQINKDGKVPKEQRKRDIAAALLYSTIFVGHYRKMENHISVVRIMVLLLSLIFHLVDKHNLEDKYWIDSYKIIWNDIVETLKLLEGEIKDGSLHRIPEDPLKSGLKQFREHGAVSLLLSLQLAECISNKEKRNDIVDYLTQVDINKHILLWGESSLVPYIFMSLILKVQEPKFASDILKNAALEIIRHNGRTSNEKLGLLSPYYDIDYAVKIKFDLLEKEFEDHTPLHSYFLNPLVHLLARFQERAFLSSVWKEISFIYFEEFVFDNNIDYYLWRSQRGENLTTAPQKQQSWSDLENKSSQTSSDMPPKTMQRFPEFLPLFLSVFPFRLNSQTLCFLDSQING